MSAKNRLLSLIAGYCRIQSNGMNIIDGIITIIYEYHKIATWSKEFKGDSIELMEDDTKAICKRRPEGQSIRADLSIEQGQSVSWELESYQSHFRCYFYGVISSKQNQFDLNPSIQLLLQGYMVCH